MTYPIPSNELQRLERLRNIGLDNSKRETEMDSIVQLAAQMFDCPYAIISMLDEDRQWFKARYGIDLEGTPREVAFCNYTVAESGPIIVEDTLKDKRFRENPYVTDYPKIRFYAGYPLSVDGESYLGALAILDSKPRTLTEKEYIQLKCLAIVTQGQMRSHAHARLAQRAIEQAEIQEAESKRQALLLEKITSVSGVGGWEFTVGTKKLLWTAKTRRIHEVDDDYVPQLGTAIDFYIPEARQIIRDAVEDGLSKCIGWDLELQIITAKGNVLWVRAIGEPVVKDDIVVKLVGTFQDIDQKKQEEFETDKSRADTLKDLEDLQRMVASLQSHEDAVLA